LTYGALATYILGSFKATSKIVALLSQWRWAYVMSGLYYTFVGIEQLPTHLVVSRREVKQ